jgi:hypothetical protein
LQATITQIRHHPVVASIDFLNKEFTISSNPSGFPYRFVSLGLRRAGVRHALPHLDLDLVGVPSSPVSSNFALRRCEAGDR